MKIPTPRVLAAAALLAASAAWAAPAKDQDSDAPRRAQSRAEAWRADVSSPENFSRFVEGAREHGGGVPGPEPSARPAPPGAPKPGLRPWLTPVPIRLEQPPFPSLRAASKEAAPARGFRLTPLVACGLGAGLGCLLLALEESGSGGAAVSPPSAAPILRGLEPAALPEPMLPRAWTPPAESAAPAAEPAAPDVYAPVSSWRAISWREQALIDRWDRSPEKALGRASFDEWLDARGAVQGVDIPRLKAKLYREAA
jgi:hypothetical protein